MWLSGVFVNGEAVPQHVAFFEKGAFYEDY